MARARGKAGTGTVGVFLYALMVAGVVLAQIVPLATLASVAPLSGKTDLPAVNFKRARMVSAPPESSLNYSSVINTLAEALQHHNKTAALGILEDLKVVISNEALKSPNATEGQIGALLNKIKAMIYQVIAGAFRGALNKLNNDFKHKIEQWIVCPPKEWFLILEVWRNVEAPEYDEPVVVTAEIIASDEIVSVIISFSVGVDNWVNETMNLEDGRYKFAITVQPYNTTVIYRVYASDVTGKWAVSPEFSYTVVDTRLPQITSVQRTPTAPDYTKRVAVYANVTEPATASGVKNVILSYFDGSERINVTMVSGSSWYTATIPELPYETFVQYRIYAFDNSGNFRVTEVKSYVVMDKTAPKIGAINWNPEEPNATEEVNVVVSVSEPTDASGIQNVTLWFRADSGEWTFATMMLKDGGWTANIPGFDGGVDVDFKVKAYDNVGNLATTHVESYTVKTVPPPEPTPLPGLPIEVFIGIGLGIIALAILTGYFLIRRRKRRIIWPYY